MAFTEQLSQGLGLPVSSLWPTNQAIATNNFITAIPLKHFKRLMGHVMQGLGAGTFTCYFCGCNTTNGTYAALTPNTTMVLNAVNTEGTLEVRSDQFNAGNQFAQLTITCAGTSSNVAASVYAGESHYKPGNQFDTTVTSVTLISRVVV